MNETLLSGKKILRQQPELLYVNNNGADKEPHSHPHPEFIFVLSGSGRFETGGNQYPVKTNDLIICGKNVTHCEYLFDYPESAMIHLGFDNVLLTGMEENELINEPFCIIHTDSRSEPIRAYFTAILAEKETPRVCGKMIQDDLLRVLLLSSLRLAVYDMNMVYSNNKTFFVAKDYIDKNFIAISSIEEICRELNVNKFYLIHIFNARMGMPPIKYILLKRMERAKSLLSSTDMPIKSIATKCGYTDIAYFCRVFKKVEHFTPLQYRRKFRSK